MKNKLIEMADNCKKGVVTLCIDGINYDVIRVKNLNDGARLCYGHIDFDNCTIELSNQCRDLQMDAITLLHEILHGVIFHYDIDVENEEEVVSKLAKGLYAVYANNK